VLRVEGAHPQTGFGPKGSGPQARAEDDAEGLAPLAPRRALYGLFRGGLVFKAHRLCVSLNAWLESNTLNGFNGVYLKAKARIWPSLEYLCHIRSTAEDDAKGRAPLAPRRALDGLFDHISK